MSKVTGAPDVTRDEISARDDRSADAGPEREHEDVIDSPRRRAPDFSQESGVGVIEDGNRRAIEEFRPVEILQAIQAARHEANTGVRFVGQARSGESD